MANKLIQRFKNPFRRNLGRPPVETKSGDTTGAKIDHKGIWKRFFYTCKVANIPYLTLLLYIAINIAQTLLLVKMPQVNANFFTGDASVESIAMFFGVELTITAIVQIGLYVNHIFRYKTNRNLRNVLWGKILRMKPS